MLFAIKLVNLLFQVYTLMLFARILGSWVPQVNEYQLMRFIAYYTDPYLNLFRRFIPPLGMFDLSPIVAFLALSFIQNLVLNFLVLWI
jgi:YggT family protein